MKTKSLFWGKMLFLLFSLVGMTLFNACSDSDDGDGSGEDTAKTPFSTVRVEAQGETVTGTVDGTNINFAFDKAEDFTTCKLIVDVNSGYKLTYPTDVNKYNMASDASLYFKDAEGKTIKYTVSLSSNALPLVDASKISVEGGYALQVNAATKELVIAYDKNMDRSKVKLNIAAGALMAGATVETTTFDLSDEPATLNIKVAGTNRPYTVKIDYSSIMTNPATFGFTDITSKKLTDEGLQSYITILNATSLKGVPVKNSNAGPDQAWWEAPQTSVEAQKAVLAALGDYADNREKVNIASCDFTIVTIDAAKVKGNIASNDAKNLFAEGLSNLIIMTGCPASEGNILVVDGNVKESVIPWGKKDFRACCGFDNNGKIQFSNATAKNGKLQIVPFFEFKGGANDVLTDDNLLPRAKWVDYIGADWNVKSAASGRPLLVRNGYKTTYKDCAINDGYEEKVGERWMGTEFRCYIGKTYDNKIGLAVSTGVKALNTIQGAYILEKLGWKYVMYLGGSQGGAESFEPTIYIKGQKIAGQEAQAAKYCVTFDAK